MIKTGRAKVMIAGGTEASITPFAMNAFANMKALSTRNDEPQKLQDHSQQTETDL